MKNRIENMKQYYGSEALESISYLEFGSIDIIHGNKKIWGYWQDQQAYDLYMFARYARDLFAFKKFVSDGNYEIEDLNKVVLASAHNKLLDYIFKYAAILSVEKNAGGICESGSSLWGWIEESIACDCVFNEGKNVNKIKSLHYIGSDIAEMMNVGARELHSSFKMDFSTKPTLTSAIDDICSRITDRLALFYGLSVSIRYAIREAEDLIRIAEKSDISVYNRLSLSLGDTVVNTYGTGKKVYIISLTELQQLLKEKGWYAKYCTANMQRERDGKDTLRASIIISERQDTLNTFIKIYEECVEKAISIEGVVQGEWKDIETLR